MALWNILGVNKIETIIESFQKRRCCSGYGQFLEEIYDDPNSMLCLFLKSTELFIRLLLIINIFEFQPSEQNIKSHKDDIVIVVTLSFAKQWGLSLVRKHQPPLNIN